ncbi:MAG TPA: phosphate ABC transporter ATP-binding protein PstB [Spirochaetia bacterium]|nr:phosphate ABC transporter ATP-binding protein PstB [Spirochaetia bacterium]
MGYKLEVRNLSVYYSSLQALREVSLNIEDNRVTALIGPSGCGKSTFLRALNRMNEIIEGTSTTGTILYDGNDIYNGYNPIMLRKQIGMVFQKPNPFPMSVYDNVAYGPRIHGTRKKRDLDDIVERSLRAAALWDEIKDRLHRPAMGISGGQQQRLCIARVLAVEPDVVLMDEPTSALDPISTARIEDLIYVLKEKYTIIIVTHNMQQAGRISDSTAFFLHGIIEESGSTEQIFFKPRNAKTEAYISGKFG